MYKNKLFTITIIFTLLMILAGFMYSVYKVTPEYNGSYENEVGDTIQVIDTAKLVDMRLDTIAFILAHRETGGTFNEKVVSKCGTYVGLLQMDRWWVNKANEYIGEKKYAHNDRFDGPKSIEIWKIHQYERNPKIGLENSLVDALEHAYYIHSGGKPNKRTTNYYKSLYVKVKNNEIEYFDLKEKR